MDVGCPPESSVARQFYGQRYGGWFGKSHRDFGNSVRSGKSTGVVPAGRRCKQHSYYWSHSAKKQQAISATGLGCRWNSLAFGVLCFMGHKSCEARKYKI